MTFSLNSAPRSLVKYNNQSISAITEVGSGAGVTDDMVLIKELTASSDATLSFLDGADDVVFDGTYPVYVFKFINMHAETDVKNFTFQVDTGTNTSYNQTVTSTVFRAYHTEDDGTTDLSFKDQADQEQGTAFQIIADTPKNDNDASTSGTLTIFSPSNTTFVKHFMATMNVSRASASENYFIAGYVNTTTALTRVQFKYAADNIDAGTIKLYGLKDS